LNSWYKKINRIHIWQLNVDTKGQKWSPCRY